VVENGGILASIPANAIILECARNRRQDSFRSFTSHLGYGLLSLHEERDFELIFNTFRHLGVCGDGGGRGLHMFMLK